MKLPGYACLLTVWLSTVLFAASDSARAQLEKGIALWDSSLILGAYARATRDAPGAEHLFKANCLWRLQILSFVAGDRGGMIRHGTTALKHLDSAIARGEDAYEADARAAYVSQLLASTGLKNGATYGPRTAKHLDAMKKVRPAGFHTEFIAAVNLLEMPSFVGGDPKKALERLAELRQKYPDSAAVAISLARAMLRNKDKDGARAVLGTVLEKEPRNRWAKKVMAEIK